MINIAEKLKLNIRGRLLLYVLSSAAIVYAVSISYLSIRSINSLVKSAKELAISHAADHANRIKNELDGIFLINRTLANLGSTYHNLDWEYFMPIFLETQKNILEKNKGFVSVGTSWELQYIDKNYTKGYGRYLNGYFRDKGQIKYFEATKNLEGDDKNSEYYKLKISKHELLTDPEYYSYSGKASENILNTNFSTPIIHNNNYIGLAGIDVDLGYFQDICDSFELLESSYVALLSNNGAWVANPDKKLYGKKITETNGIFAAKHSILEKIQAGEPFNIIDTDTLGNEIFYAYAPITNTGDPHPWVVLVAVPMDIVLAPSKVQRQISLVIGILGIFIMTLMIYYISHTISDPIKQTTLLIKKLALGQIDSASFSVAKHRSDEIGEMKSSIEALNNGLKEVLVFASEIGAGNLNVQYNKLSDKDMLGQALIDMQQNLRNTQAELEKKQEEDKKQRWISDNHSQLMDIIRNNSDNMKTMGYEIVRYIVTQVRACQGALYILNDNVNDDQYYETLAAVAYERKQLLNTKIKSEEGLVGRCAYEQLSIILTDVPDDYISITSGLGDAPPTCIALFPLIVNDITLGVLEIVSFNKLEPHELEYIAKTSEGIASTINSTRISKKTEQLLRQSQEQAEALSQQEEEMRQNIEEMQATQEETQKREHDLRGLIDAINSVSMVAVYDISGTVTDINTKFCNFLETPKEILIGKRYGSLIANDTDKIYTDSMWNDLLQSKTKQIIRKVEIGRKTFWITELFTPILNFYGEPEKIYHIVVDITRIMKNDK